MARALVLGLGNILLRDEGVGVRVVEALAERYVLPAGVEVVDGGTCGMDLLDTLAGCEHLLVCDAVRTGAPLGSVVKLAGDQVPALFQVRYSPHQLGLMDVLATLNLTGEAPATLTLVGIVPADLRLGLELSSVVAEAAEQAVEALVAALRRLGFTLTSWSEALCSPSPLFLPAKENEECRYRLDCQGTGVQSI